MRCKVYFNYIFSNNEMLYYVRVQLYILLSTQFNSFSFFVHIFDNIMMITNIWFLFKGCMKNLAWFIQLNVIVKAVISYESDFFFFLNVDIITEIITFNIIF